MTETCGMICINLPELKDELDNVGLPVPSADIKVVDIPEVGYLTTNNPLQGEVCPWVCGR
jgi:long-chain acyl-CoA synthetase